MQLMDIVVPQMGEGLQEVRVLGFLKKPGEKVSRDDPLYEMETDKATMQVESEHEGVLKEWNAKENDIMPVGAVIARIECESRTTSATATTQPPSPTPAPAAPQQTRAPAAQQTPGNNHRRVRRGGPLIPPRTRAVAKRFGVPMEELPNIPAPSGKLMPEDVERYANTRTQAPAPSAAPARQADSPYREEALPAQQRTFIYRIKRSSQVVVPATLGRPLNWEAVERSRKTMLKRFPELQAPGFRLTSFQVFAYTVAQAAKDHPKFRSTLVGEEKIRRYDHLNMGVAVAREDDELVTALIANSDSHNFPSFAKTMAERVRLARSGTDQATESMQVLLTYMGRHEITDAIPLLVAPSVAVLFLGAPYRDADGKTVANVTMTFDHRLINGVGAANFVNRIAHQTEILGKT